MKTTALPRPAPPPRAGERTPQIAEHGKKSGARPMVRQDLVHIRDQLMVRSLIFWDGNTCSNKNSQERDVPIRTWHKNFPEFSNLNNSKPIIPTHVFGSDDSDRFSTARRSDRRLGWRPRPPGRQGVSSPGLRRPPPLRAFDLQCCNLCAGRPATVLLNRDLTLGGTGHNLLVVGGPGTGRGSLRAEAQKLSR